MRPERWRKTQRLPIRNRRTFHGDGELQQARSVICPRRDAAVALAVCHACDACDGVHLDERGGTVLCRAPAPPLESLLPVAARRLLPAAAERTSIADLMARQVSCVTADVSLEALTALCLERGLGAAPVVDDEGYPIGIVSKTDLVRRQFESGGDEAVSAAEPRLDAPAYVTSAPAVTVAEVMTPIAYTLGERDPLSRAAALMTVERVHHLPVVGDDGRVVGMLSAFDFARFLARHICDLPDGADEADGADENR